MSRTPEVFHRDADNEIHLAWRDEEITVKRLEIRGRGAAELKRIFGEIFDRCRTIEEARREFEAMFEHLR